MSAANTDPSDDRPRFDLIKVLVVAGILMIVAALVNERAHRGDPRYRISIARRIYQELGQFFCGDSFRDIQP